MSFFAKRNLSEEEQHQLRAYYHEVCDQLMISPIDLRFEEIEGALGAFVFGKDEEGDPDPICIRVNLSKSFESCKKTIAHEARHQYQCAWFMIDDSDPFKEALSRQSEKGSTFCRDEKLLYDISWQEVDANAFADWYAAGCEGVLPFIPTDEDLWEQARKERRRRHSIARRFFELSVERYYQFSKKERKGEIRRHII